VHRRRWLFGDQLGASFLDSVGQPVLLTEARRVFPAAPVPPAEGAPGSVGHAAPGTWTGCRPAATPPRGLTSLDRLSDLDELIERGPKG